MQGYRKMTKRQFGFPDHEENVIGYLHEVSPVKRSSNNTLYFNATLQTGDLLRRLVSFDADKHIAFINAQKICSPVKLTGITITPSRDGQGTDIKVNRFSSLTVVKDSEVNFKKRKLNFDEVRLINITDVKHPSGLITVQAKVIRFGESTNEQLFNKTLLKREVIIADKTGSIILNAWNTHIDQLEKDKSYKIENVSSRTYDLLKLTTTTKSVITPISNIPSVETRYAETQLSKISASVKQVSISFTKKCSACRKVVQLQDIGAIYTRCDACKMKQCSDDLISTTCKLNVQNTDTKLVHKVTAFQEVLTSFLQKQNQLKLLDDPDALEEYLLGKKLDITSSRDICSMVSIVEDTPSVKSPEVKTNS